MAQHSLSGTSLHRQTTEFVRAHKDVSSMAGEAGGHFKLCSLLMKRVRELMRGAPKLTELQSKNLINIAMQEFEEGKLAILTPDEARKLGLKLLGATDDETGGPF